MVYLRPASACSHSSAGYRIAKASPEIGHIHYATLYPKIKQYGIT